jgi:hypothetical protein
MQATNMVMLFGNTVESFQAAAQFQLSNFTALGQNFEVAVHRPKADAGHPFANHFVDFISAGMGSNVSKLFQDNLPLTRHPKIWGFFQNRNLLC